MDEKLVMLSVEAIQDPEKWQRVLQHIMHSTQAKAAMITLRDGRSCQIVNDDELESKFHSPLIQGFSYDAVVYYLQELRTIDPWAEAQKTHYPQRPILMSRVCNPDDVPDQRFFSWLKQYDILDTVAFELNQMPRHWTACNIFIERQKSEAAEAALAYATEHHLFLKSAWQSSQQLLHSQQSSRATLDHMANLNISTCITGPNGEVMNGNSAFDQLLALGHIETHGPKRRLAVPHSSRLLGDAAWLEQAKMEANEFAPTLTIYAVPFTPDPLYVGKREKWWLLTFQIEEIYTISPAELNLLTSQEKDLFAAIRSGSSIASAGEIIGVKRSRAFDIWASVRSKLGISNAHQIR